MFKVRMTLKVERVLKVVIPKTRKKRDCGDNDVADKPISRGALQCLKSIVLKGKNVNSILLMGMLCCWLGHMRRSKDRRICLSESYLRETLRLIIGQSLVLLRIMNRTMMVSTQVIGLLTRSQRNSPKLFWVDMID